MELFGSGRLLLFFMKMLLIGILGYLEGFFVGLFVLLILNRLIFLFVFFDRSKFEVRCLEFWGYLLFKIVVVCILFEFCLFELFFFVFDFIFCELLLRFFLLFELVMFLLLYLVFFLFELLLEEVLELIVFICVL